MGEARRELHGDPEAMRRFAVRVDALGTPGPVAEPPDPSACTGAMGACSAFATADAVATVALARFLEETRKSLAVLTEAAAAAAEDYQATDRVGAQAVVFLAGE